jgi:hypothetical protein
VVYPGDTYNFLLILRGTNGVDPGVSGTPTITIIDAATGTAQVTNQNMTLIATSKKVYKYAWAIPATQTAGRYIAIADYAVDLAGGVSYSTYDNVHIETVDIGDTRIQGKVALDDTVAKDSTVAKDATVAHATDIVAVNPENSASVQAIKAKTDLLPVTPADQTTLTAVQSAVQAVQDAALCHMTIDKTVIPNTLTIRRFGDNVILAVYNLTDDSNSTIRTRTV